MATNGNLEDLLFDTMDAVSRFRGGQREAVAAALDAGGLLAQAKALIPHGGWADWLQRVGVKPRTASAWMKLAAMDVTVEEVIERGGINATLRRLQIGNRCRFGGIGTGPGVGGRGSRHRRRQA